MHRRKLAADLRFADSVVRNSASFELFCEGAVYLVDKNNWLRSYANDLPAAQLDSEVVASKTVRRKDYQSKSVDVCGKIDGIQSNTRDIAALLFEITNLKDTIRFRLYYIDTDGVLAELRQNNPKSTPLTLIVGWSPGTTLKAKGYRVVEHSRITAHMSPATNTIKVYYYPKEFPQA
ncbi:hypothetical protein N0V83_009686, partial [Neocucurbitaria cava]